VRSRNEARKREDEDEDEDEGDDEDEDEGETRTRAALSDSEDLDYKRRSHCAIATRHHTARERGENDDRESSEVFETRELAEKGEGE